MMVCQQRAARGDRPVTDVTHSRLPSPRLPVDSPCRDPRARFWGRHMERESACRRDRSGRRRPACAAASAHVYAGAGATIFTADRGRGRRQRRPILAPRWLARIPSSHRGRGRHRHPGRSTSTSSALPVSVGLESEYGVFAVGWLPIPLVGDLFGRVGYADMTIKADWAARFGVRRWLGPRLRRRFPVQQHPLHTAPPRIQPLRAGRCRSELVRRLGAIPVLIRPRTPRL